VGDGSKVRFWHDLWCGDMTLEEAFPVLFGIACVEDAFVATHVEFFGGASKWNMSFTRTALDWEVEAFASFFRVLYLAREGRVLLMWCLWVSLLQSCWLRRWRWCCTTLGRRISSNPSGRVSKF
jgi:hypothetical protein